MSSDFYLCEMWPRAEQHGAGLRLRALCRSAVCPGSSLNTVLCRLLLRYANRDVRHQIWLTVARGGLCVVEDEAMCARAVFFRDEADESSGEGGHAVCGRTYAR